MKKKCLAHIAKPPGDASGQNDICDHSPSPRSRGKEAWLRATCGLLIFPTGPLLLCSVSEWRHPSYTVNQTNLLPLSAPNINPSWSHIHPTCKPAFSTLHSKSPKPISLLPISVAGISSKLKPDHRSFCFKFFSGSYCPQSEFCELFGIAEGPL